MRKQAKSFSLSVYRSKHVAPYLPHLGELRATLFKEWPYLYVCQDTTLESGYLASYAESPDALLVVAYDGDVVIAIAAGIPLKDVHLGDMLVEKLEAPVEQYYYIADVVVAQAYQSDGVGIRVAKMLDVEMLALGERYSHHCFMTISRPDDHPLRPTYGRTTAQLDRVFERATGFVKTELLLPCVWPTLQPDGSAMDEENLLRMWIRKA